MLQSSAGVVVCVSKTHVRVFFDSFVSVRLVATRYILQQVAEWTYRTC